MRRTLLVLLLLASTGQVGAEPEPWVFLDGPLEIHGMRRADVDGDGVRDLFVLHARQLVGWRGKADALPDAKPTWDVTLADDVSFVDLDPGRGVLLYGTQGLTRWDVKTGRRTPVPGAQPLGWRDADGAQFATLSDGRDGLVLPVATGVRWRQKDGNELSIDVARRRYVEASGPFLEDAASTVIQRAPVWVGQLAKDGASVPALWLLGDRTLRGHAADGAVTIELPARPATGDRRLHDFTGDRTPEVFQRSGNNLEGHYSIFKTPVISRTPGEPGTPVQAPLSRLSLSGYQLDPEFPDVNGDGRDDFVITTIGMDGTNLLRAVTSGTVTAETNLFLNRTGSDPMKLFDPEPDARIKSEIGVKLHFTYAGTIDVKRSFTIVTRGDFDGDGALDLLIRTAPDTVTVRAGTKTGGWAEEGRTVSIPPIGDHPDVEGYADDVDGRAGDGKPRRDELLLLYRKGPGGRDRLCIVRIP